MQQCGRIYKAASHEAGLIFEKRQYQTESVNAGIITDVSLLRGVTQN